jgi:hypothetical protein
MATAIKKSAVLLAVPALMGVFAGSATADPGVDGAATPANPDDFSNCPAGSVCYYTGLNGSGAKCQWSGFDTQHADDCSWAADTNVRSIYNHGTSSSFAGVCSYRFPDFGTDPPLVWQAQGVAVNLPGDGWKVLSHRWVKGVGVAAC